jgi:hypothetical protein
MSSFLAKAEVVIDRSAPEIIAFWFAYCSRDKQERALKQKNLARLIVTEYAPHDHVTAFVGRAPFPLYPREFLERHVCAMTPEGHSICASATVSQEVDYGFKKKTVKAHRTTVRQALPMNRTSLPHH